MLKIILNIYYKPVEQLKKIIEENKDLYFPINGGASLRGDEWCDKHLHYDDIGDNISAKNKLYNEMTSIYWAWKHYEELGNPDYIGFNHYRRFFKKDDIEDYEKYEVMISKPICPNYFNLMMQYYILHRIDDLQICIQTLAVADMDFAKDFTYYMTHNNKTFAPCNMFIMKKQMFFEWCEFIFPILAKLENLISVEGRDNYQKRALCFLTERMFGCWCMNRIVRNKMNAKFLDIEEKLDFKDNKLNERGTYDEDGACMHSQG